MGDSLGTLCRLHELIRENIINLLINVDIMLNAEDVLDISDPTSGIFDDEIKGEALNMCRRNIRNGSYYV